jgi:hypothetical protein
MRFCAAVVAASAAALVASDWANAIHSIKTITSFWAAALVGDHYKVLIDVHMQGSNGGQWAWYHGVKALLLQLGWGLQDCLQPQRALNDLQKAMSYLVGLKMICRSQYSATTVALRWQTLNENSNTLIIQMASTAPVFLISLTKSFLP